MSFKYISSNTLEHLSLHDCIIESATFETDDLALLFEHIDVLHSHPLNSFDVAKYSGKALLIFKNCKILKSFIYDTSKVKKKVIHAEQDAQKVDVEITKLAAEFEVLSLEQLDGDYGYLVYKFDGNCAAELGGDFGQFILMFDSVLVCWDELIDDAWFVGFNQRKGD